MKVKDLISQLKSFDQELEVLCSTEDDDLLPPGLGVRLLDIQDVSVHDAEKCRGDDGVPSLKLGKSSSSQKHVFIDVTSDF